VRKPQCTYLGEQVVVTGEPIGVEYSSLEGIVEVL